MTSYASSKPDYIRAIELLVTGQVDPEILLKIYDLKEADQGFKDSENLRVMKAILKCQN